MSNIIIDENLKLLQINYLALKVDVLFNFPSRSCHTCNITCGKAMYNVPDVIVIQACAIMKILHSTLSTVCTN